MSVIVCFSVVTSSTFAFAYHIDYAGGDSDFKLFGKTTDEKGGQIVTVKVESDGNVIWNRQTETNRLGEYEFTITILDGLSGDISFNVNDGAGVETTSLYKSTSDEVDRALATVNSAGIRTAILSTLQS